MNVTGKIKGIGIDYLTRKMELTLTLNETDAVTAGYDNLKDLDLLDVTIEKHKKRRSLNANAYFHVLVGKLANKLRTSNTFMKNRLICEYGQPLIINGQLQHIGSSIDWEHLMEYMHCSPAPFDMQPDDDSTVYLIYRGSHTYTQEEMQTLIAGTVDDCKTQGIETLTPAEIERMVNAWHANQPSQNA